MRMAEISRLILALAFCLRRIHVEPQELHPSKPSKPPENKPNTPKIMAKRWCPPPKWPSWASKSKRQGSESSRPWNTHRPPRFFQVSRCLHLRFSPRRSSRARAHWASALARCRGCQAPAPPGWRNPPPEAPGAKCMAAGSKAPLIWDMSYLI